MRKLLWLVIPAALILVVLTLPARLIVPHLEVGENVRAVRGTLWRGQAIWQQPDLVPLDLSWRWSGGRRWDWQAQGEGVDLAGGWQPRMNATELLEVSGRIDIHRLDVELWLLYVRPAGHVELALDRVLLREAEVPELSGQLVWRNARLEGTIHESLGEIVVDLVREGQDQQLRVRSMEPGAIQVQGQIGLSPERYEVDLWLRPQAGRPELLRQIAWLGEPQPDGQVRIRLSGGLGW